MLYYICMYIKLLVGLYGTNEMIIFFFFICMYVGIVVVSKIMQMENLKQSNK